MLSTSFDIDTLKGISYSHVKQHFYHMWSELQHEKNFWDCIRQYCNHQSEPATYLAVMLVSQVLLHNWRIRPDTESPAAAWAAIEWRLAALDLQDDIPPARVAENSTYSRERVS
jgi:hypothetical protein